MGWHSVDPSSLEFVERAPREGEAETRSVADLIPALELQQSRARLWRYPPHTTGRRHVEQVQEEVFVVISGALTMLLGEPPERVAVGRGGVVAVEPGTPLQIRNESEDELLVYIYGSPPDQTPAEFLGDGF